MSRRLSVQAKKENKKPKVRFPDELVFLDHIKEHDTGAINSMLRRASMQININGLNEMGLSPIHSAVLENNLGAIKLLLAHGADVNLRDTDTWTPLHAACAEGHTDIVRYLLAHGADKTLKTQEGERPIDLVDTRDLRTIGAMLETEETRHSYLRDMEQKKNESDDSDSNSSSESRSRSSSPGNPSGSKKK